MSAPSLPLILFAVADAIARGRMPEPEGLRYDTDSGLTFDFDNEADARRWAKRLGIDVATWSSQPYTGPAGSRIEGQQFTLINGYGTWHGATARIHVLEPVTVEVAQVAS